MWRRRQTSSAPSPGPTGPPDPDGLSRRRRWTVLALPLLAVSAWLTSRLGLQHDARDFLPAGGRSSTEAWAAALDPVGAADRVVVVLESAHAVELQHAGPVLDALAARLRASPGVRQVGYRLDPAMQAFLEQELPKQLELLLDPAELQVLGDRIERARIEQALANGPRSVDPLAVLGPGLQVLARPKGDVRATLDDGYFTVPGHRLYFLVIEPDTSLDRLAPARAFVDMVDRVVNQVARDPAFETALKGKRLFAVGRPISFVGVVDAAQADARRVALASAVIVTLMLCWFFRGVVAPLAIIGTVTAGLALTGAVAYLAYGAISIVAWYFVAVLVGLGDEFGVYIASNYRLTGRVHQTRGAALDEALRRSARPMVVGALTAATAFMALATSSYRAIVQVAWLSALGIALVLACSFTLLPLALSWVPPARREFPGRRRIIAWISRIGERHRASSLAAWLVLVAASCWIAPSVRFEPHPWKVLLRGSPGMEDLEHVRRALGVSFAQVIMISRGATASEALAADREAVRAMERIRIRAGVAALQSLSYWIHTPAEQQAALLYVRARRATFSAERFQEDFRAALARHPDARPDLGGEYLQRVSRFLDPDPRPFTLDSLRRTNTALAKLVDQHIVHHEGEVIALTYLHLAQYPWADNVADRFMTTVGTAGGESLKHATFVGQSLRRAEHARLLRRDLIVATTLAMALVTLILIVEFRRPVLVLLALLPLVAGVSVSLALMALLGIELNVLTLTIAPLLAGLGVDDGIHVLERLRRGNSTETVLEEVGSPMAITTFTTAAGFACLGLARFPGVQQLGLVATVGLLACLAASVHLLPTCYALVAGGSRPAPDA